MEGEEAVLSSMVGSPSGPERSGGRRPPTLLLGDAKADGRRKRVGWPPLRAWAVPGSSRAYEEGRGAAPSRDGRVPCSTKAPSPAIVIRALAALRRPAQSRRA